MIKILLAEASSPTILVTAEPTTFFRASHDAPLVYIYQLLHHSHLVQSRTVWLLGTYREGWGKYFVDHSEELGGIGRAWGKNSLWLFPESRHPSAIHRDPYVGKKKTLAHRIGNYSLWSSSHIHLPDFCPQTFHCRAKILHPWKIFFFLHYTYISPQHILGSLHSFCKIHRDQWVKYQLKNVQPERRGFKRRQFVSSLSTSSH